MSPAGRRRAGHPRAPGPTLRRLAWVRYEIRRFLRFSQDAARKAGLTPMQHQLLLGAAGFTGRGSATVSELAEFLQVRHNAVVELVKRGKSLGLVSKRRGPGDRRFILVQPTARGEALLKTLARVHLDEIRRIRTQLRLIDSKQPRILRHDGR